MSVSPDIGEWPIDALPENWSWASFVDVWSDNTDSKRKLPKKKYSGSGKFPVVDQGEDLIGGFSDDQSLKSLAPIPSIVWGDHTRCVKYLDQPFVQGADGVKVLTPTAALFPMFGYFALKAIKIPDKGYSRHFKFLRSSSFPVPPLNEQRRIVAKLDSLFERTRRAREELSHIPRLIDNYKKAILEALFSPINLGACRNLCFSDVVAEGLIGLIRAKTQQSPDLLYPYVRMNHYDMWGNWNDINLTHVEASSEESARYELRGGDVLFNTRNSTQLVGKVAIWPEGKRGFLYNNNLLRLRFSEEVLPEYAFVYMLSSPFRDHIEQMKSATTSVAAIYQRSLYSAPFPVPPKKKQQEIIAVVLSCFKSIYVLAEESMRAKLSLDHLDQANLAKAFQGELVPQNSNDEPAFVLLDRIRAERSGAARSGRGWRGRDIPGQKELERLKESGSI